MKKLELKFGSIKEMLTKDQMQLISGGTCTWYWHNGPGCVGGTVPTSPGQAGCQTGADHNCDNNPCCDNVNCDC
jgi:hypothetical protein